MPAPTKIIGKLWLKLNICGQSWEVRFAPEKQFRIKKNERLDGLSDADLNVIYLDDELLPCQRPMVLWHELMHAVFSASGLDGDFAEHLKHKPKWSDIEEHLCSVFSIPLFDALERNGLLKEPVQPKE